jgi:large subunit ribosomal protein L28
MPRRCELTGTKLSKGHKVSHSNIKTMRRFQPNLKSTSLYSEALKRPVRMRVTTQALRTIAKIGGIDAFLRGTDDARLPPEALAVKRQVLRSSR